MVYCVILCKGKERERERVEFFRTSEWVVCVSQSKDDFEQLFVGFWLSSSTHSLVRRALGLHLLHISGHQILT